MIIINIILYSGKNSAVLNYGNSGSPNNGVIKDGDMWYEQSLNYV